MHSWLTEHVQNIEKVVKSDASELKKILAEAKLISREVKDAARSQKECCLKLNKRFDDIEHTLAIVNDKLDQLLAPPPEPPAVGFKITLENAS